LQHLVLLFGTEPKRSCRDLCGNGRFCDGRIGRHKADVVHMDMRIVLKSCFDLLGDLSGLGPAAHGKSSDQFCQAGLRNFGTKVNAGYARAGEHAREALFRCSRLEGCSVEKELVPGYGEQQTGIIVADRRS
jgi:hypothetical protein